MTLDKDYLHYPKRHYGMDHNHYQWSQLSERAKVVWPNNAKLAVWVNICVQFFPLNQGKTEVPVPGGMKMPYPDLRHFSLRDYGNRVGIFRILKALDNYSITPTFSINGAMVNRASYLMNIIKERKDEVIAHGWKMDNLHCGELEKETESSWIAQTLDTLNSVFENPVTGWLSPGRLQTANTASLLAEHGVKYQCDWVNDDMPYPFHTESGNLLSMPLSNELDDYFILGSNLHSEESYAEQLTDACNFLLNEAEQQGGRILALNIHPWMLGQPHRIAYFEQVLSHLSSKNIWSASATDILNMWSKQALPSKENDI